jgi:carboxyl-terminal processing protease
MQALSSWLDMKHLTYSHDPGELKVTIKKFYRAGGVSTQLQGVLSDIELPSIDDAADVGERSLPDAMPCDAVTSADHLEEMELNRVKPYLAELQARSRQRVEKDKDFSYMREDIARFRKEEADKSLSLNLAERVTEQKSDTALMEARKKERLSRGKRNEKVYEITLKNVDLAKLQPYNSKSHAGVAAKNDSGLDFSGDDAASDQPALDPTLAETKRILTDYIELLKKGPIIAGHTQTSPNLPTRLEGVSGQ